MMDTKSPALASSASLFDAEPKVRLTQYRQSRYIYHASMQL